MQSIKGLHSLAEIFPAMPSVEFEALVEDIQANGILNPIMVHEGLVLDGRHRWKASQLLGIECPMRELTAFDDPLSVVISANAHRRNLSKSQRACAALKAMPELSAAALKRMTGGGTQKIEWGREAAEEAARIFGTNRQYIYDAQMILDADPALFAEVFAGELPISAAKTKLKQADNEAIRTARMSLPLGTYHTLVVDPPWPMKKIERDVRPKQDGDFEYPTMSLDQIKGGFLEASDGDSRRIKDFAKDDAHLYLWTTQKFLPAAIEIIKAWDFRYQCILTWRKNVGFTPYSWMYSTEHVVFASRGSLPLLKKGLRLDFEGKVREHSRKPDEFFDLVCAVSPEPRVELFAREPRDGFETVGIEKAKF